MQILVVEDEIMLAESLKEILEKNKHTVYLAYDGEEGLEIARSLALDLIILDVMLPKLNGYQVARGLRKDKKGTLILMLTARIIISRSPLMNGNCLPVSMLCFEGRVKR